ncbi:beta-lactamase/transpeptidase-like protein [Meredithblackwellia eburnea MCA 4105]
MVVKLSQDAIKEMDAAIDDATKDPYRGLPRAVVIVASKDAGVIYKHSSGYEQVPDYSNKDQLASSPLISDKSVFELWSCTKLITVIAALQLVEKGIIKLDDEASLYVPELKTIKRLVSYDGDEPELVDSPSPTVEQLITHTSRFTYVDSKHPRHEKYSKSNKIPAASGPESSRESITKIPLIYEPGKTWHYGISNDWLALVVQDVTKTDLETYFQTNIFGPLGINDISFVTPNPRKINIAHSPEKKGDPYTFQAGITHKWNCGFGGHGLFGSPSSYLKVLQAILGGGGPLLKPETVKMMFEPHVSTAEGLASLKEFTKDGNNPSMRKETGDYVGPNFGYGGALLMDDLASGRKKGSLNWSGMASTYWVIDPASEIAFVVFTNVLPYGPEQIWDMWDKVETSLYKGLSHE